MQYQLACTRPRDFFVNLVPLGEYGEGYSVLDMVKAFEEVSGKSIPYEVVARRAGDIAETYADPALAKSELGWTAARGRPEMMKDAWRWQSDNPEGY